MRLPIILTLTTCLSLGAQGAGHGGHDGMGGPGGPGGQGGPMGGLGGQMEAPEDSRPDGADPLIRMLKRLALTGAQQKRVEEILDRHRDEADSLHEEVFEKERAFLKASFDMNVKEAKLKELGAALEDAKLQVVLDARATVREVLALLTDDQQDKAKRILSHPRMAFGGLGPMGPGMMGPGAMPPPPPPMGGPDCHD